MKYNNIFSAAFVFRGEDGCGENYTDFSNVYDNTGNFKLESDLKTVLKKIFTDNDSDEFVLSTNFNRNEKPFREFLNISSFKNYEDCYFYLRSEYEGLINEKCINCEVMLSKYNIYNKEAPACKSCVDIMDTWSSPDFNITEEIINTIESDNAPKPNDTFLKAASRYQNKSKVPSIKTVEDLDKLIGNDNINDYTLPYNIITRLLPNFDHNHPLVSWLISNGHLEILDDAIKCMFENKDYNICDAVDYANSSLYNEWSISAG